MLKRAFLCGLIWSIGSLQHIVGGNIHLPFLFAALILGIAECGLSVKYCRKKGAALAAIAVLQTVYYIAALVYLLSTESDNTIRAFDSATAVCMLTLLLSTITAILKDFHRT